MKNKLKNFLKKKKKGTADFIFPLFLILFACILFTYEFNIKIINHTKAEVEDSIAAATLASACINTYSYSDFNESSSKIINECYDIFRQSFIENMRLKDDLTPIENTLTDRLIEDPLVIEEYSYYCIKDNIVYKTVYGNAAIINREEGAVGTVKTPNNIDVVCPTFYVRVGMNIINPITKEKIYITKEFSVDLVSY